MCVCVCVCECLPAGPAEAECSVFLFFSNLISAKDLTLKSRKAGLMDEGCTVSTPVG